MTDEPETEASEPETPAQRIAKVFADTWLRAKAATMPGEHLDRHSAIDEHFERLEQEFAPVLAQVLGPYLESGTLPPEWQAIFGEAAEPTHVWAFFVQIASFVGAMFAMLPALGQVFAQSYVNQAWMNMPDKPLAPADLADAVLRNVMDVGAAWSEAAMSGVNQQRFNDLVAITGEPPGIMDMLKLELRGALLPGVLDQAIRYSRIKDIYIDNVHDLAYTQMSPADAIMAAIKEVVSLDEARALFTRGGGLADDFETVYEATGDSIAIQQALTLWKYGLISEQEVNLALGRSRINPIFYPVAKLTHFHPLSAFQISKAITAGTVTPAEGEKWLIQNGTPADQAHALATAHASGGTAKAHTETESLVTAAYVDHVYSYAQANAALINIGYHPDVAALILEVADAKRGQSQTNHAVSVVRANYTAHRLSRTQAITELDQLLIPADARDKWLTEWDLEIAAHPKTLTATQLATAGKDGFLLPEEVFSRIVGEGYTAADAKVIMQLHKAPLPANA